MNNRVVSIATWILAVVLCLVFLGAGSSHLPSRPMMRDEFVSLGYPLWFMYVTGGIEIVSAVLLLIPRTSRIGAGLIICVMLGAIFSHLIHGQASMIIAPLVLLILAVIEFQLRGSLQASRLRANHA